MLKALLVLLLAAICVSSTPASPKDTSSGSVAGMARMSVVDLQEMDIDGVHTFCTGVAVGPHTILTEKHCMGIKDTLYSGVGCKEDKQIAFDGTDNVLVHTCHLWTNYIPLSLYFPSIGDKMFEYGHPYGGPVMYREGYLSGIVNNDGSDPDWDDTPRGIIFIWDVNETHGDSGGPILTMDGQLICTTSFGWHLEGDGFQLMGCYPPRFNKQQLALIK